MIFARKEIKMNGYRKQSPEIKTTISHDDKTVTVWVDAQNGYGATVRANFVVTFTFASKDTYSVALCTVS